MALEMHAMMYPMSQPVWMGLPFVGSRLAIAPNTQNNAKRVRRIPPIIRIGFMLSIILRRIAIL